MSVTMKDMGITNASWGVCGFTSSFYAMWKLEKSSRAQLANAPAAYSVIAEIKSYLRMLQASGDITAIKDIEAFCRSFGKPYDTFTVEGYCKRVSASVALNDEQIKSNPLFSIGMPPHSVCDYLKRMWDYNSKVTKVPPGRDPGGDAIIGMCVKSGTRDPSGKKVKTGYNRLVHYMYRRNGKIWSWGEDSYSSIEKAAEGGADWAKGWKIGWVIQIGSKGALQN